MGPRNLYELAMRYSPEPVAEWHPPARLLKEPTERIADLESAVRQLSEKVAHLNRLVDALETVNYRSRHFP